MVKFDAEVFQYMKRDEFRVLQAIEQGMKNHRLVPTELIESIAGQQRGNCYRWIQNLHKHKLVVHESKPYDGYRLTFPGYDFLAIRAFVSRGLISGVGRQIGVGKESDVFEVTNDHGEIMVLKLHRLGRVCFRNVKNKRDYLKGRHKSNWLYMSRLSSLREFAYMKVLDANGFPVPKPIDVNRHGVLMSMITTSDQEQAKPMYQVRKMNDVVKGYNTCMGLITRLAEHGLVHCDFNEFNLMIDDNETITLIDFPQMISTDHPDAHDHFGRDVGCIVKWFRKKYHYEGSVPVLDQEKATTKRLDVEVEASGYVKETDEIEAILAAATAADGSDEKEGEALEPPEFGHGQPPELETVDPALPRQTDEANEHVNSHDSGNESEHSDEKAPGKFDRDRDKRGRASGRSKKDGPVRRRQRTELTMKEIQNRVKQKLKQQRIRRKGKSVHKTAQKNKVKNQTKHDLKSGSRW